LPVGVSPRKNKNVCCVGAYFVKKCSTICKKFFNNFTFISKDFNSDIFLMKFSYIFVELLSVVVDEGEGQGHAQRVQLEGVGATLPDNNPSAVKFTVHLTLIAVTVTINCDLNQWKCIRDARFTRHK
jgi:hypothetical protein